MIHLVDDDESFRTAVSRLLRTVGYAVRTYASAGDFLMAEGGDAPGCVLMDICMPGPSGLELHEALAKRAESLPVVFLTGHGNIPTSVRAIKAGAVDFLTKPVKREVLLNAVQVALARDAERRRNRVQWHKWHALSATLTPREREVFEQVVAGKPNKQIAAELGVAERTIKAHRAQVMEKMRATSFADLVHIADQIRSGQSSQGARPSV